QSRGVGRAGDGKTRVNGGGDSVGVGTDGTDGSCPVLYGYDGYGNGKSARAWAWIGRHGKEKAHRVMYGGEQGEEGQGRRKEK
ncbi:hypothetical protein V500_06279, partial [Pseudogymnoascus sp. VKM F-4518 (FW-2643)]